MDPQTLPLPDKASDVVGYQSASGKQLTQRDQELIQASREALAGAVQNVRRADYTNHGWDGMDPKTLPLPENGADIQAIAGIHPRRPKTR